MRIFILLLVIGCAFNKKDPVSTRPLNSENHTLKRSLSCMDSNKMQIKVISKNGILGYLCPEGEKFEDGFFLCDSKGSEVFILMDGLKSNYVDNQKVTLPDNKCFKSDGVQMVSNKFLYGDQKSPMMEALKEMYRSKGIDPALLKTEDETRRVRRVQIISAY